MTMQRFTHMTPSTLDEALSLLREKGNKAKIIAGGSDLMVHLKHKTAVPEFVINIKELKGLSGIAVSSGNTMTIGPLTTLTDISQSGTVRELFPILAEAAGKVASVQIRNVATLGGNICLDTRCWYYNQSAQWRRSIPRCYKMGGDQCLVIKNSDRCNAVFLADTAPALMALDARLTIVRKGGERIIPIHEFYNGSGHPPNLLTPNEILAGIELAKTPANSFSVFFKDAPRAVVDFALVNMAMRITFKDHKDVCEDARIAIGGVNSYPVRTITGEDALRDHKITDRVIEHVAERAVKDSSPISPIWVSPNQRRATVKHFVKKGLKAALASVQKNRQD
jgi:4-hydroxybenzoyl-CoA reductase subunit beta